MWVQRCWLPRNRCWEGRACPALVGRVGGEGPAPPSWGRVRALGPCSRCPPCLHSPRILLCSFWKLLATQSPFSRQCYFLRPFRINLSTYFLKSLLIFVFSQFSSVTQSCPTLCEPMDCSMPGLPIHRQLLEFTQTHVHRDGDGTPPSYPLLPPSPPTFNLSQHQGLFP